MPTFVGALDHGTTSSRFIIFDTDGNPVAIHQHEFRQIYPQSGWHEHNPNEIMESVEQCIEGGVKKFLDAGHQKSDLKCVGVTNQRETTVVWDIKTGEPTHNAIAWPDTRTASMVREYKRKAGTEIPLHDVCGLPLSTYPSCVKLMWLIKNDPKTKEAYEAGRLAFGTPDTWLIYKLTGGVDGGKFVTDSTNASRTMFMNIHTLKYNDEALTFFGLDKTKINLPEIVPSSSATAYGVIKSGILAGVPIMGVLGDQSAALVGQQGFSPGSAKNTYGTGCFLLYNVGEKPVISKHGLLATIAYDFTGVQGQDKPIYALEGSIAVAGSAVKFLINNLGLATESHQITDLAATVPDNGGLVFVTAFSGLFAPYWIDDAKGTIFGVTQFTQKGHIARATLEATCFQTKAILDAMEKDSGKALAELRVDGGMSNSDLCMQSQANIIEIPVDRPAMRETTALGAAIAAGFAAGIWTSFDQLKEINSQGRSLFKPNVSKEQSAKMYAVWSKAVQMCKGWVEAEETKDPAAITGAGAGTGDAGVASQVKAAADSVVASVSKVVSGQGGEVVEGLAQTLKDVALNMKAAAESVLEK